MDDKIELTVLTNEITGEICANRCGSKCCDLKLSDHFVPVEIVDYANLSRIGIEKFVSFYSTLEAPQLLHKLNGKCVFLKETTGLCSIYEFRPLACRNYPFRESEEEEAELPEWCELYHRSSEELELQRIKDAQSRHEQYYNHQREIDPEVLMEYLEMDRSNTIFHLDRMNEFKEIANTEEFTLIKAISKKALKVANSHLDTIIENMTTNWLIYNILVFDESFSIIAKIEGVFRSNEEVQVPQIEEFPPSYDEYDRIYRITMATDEYKENSITGSILPDDFQNHLARKLEDKIPVNSEFQ